MNAGQVNTLGGTCELLGLATVAWDLAGLASYRGDLARLRAWLDARRRTVVATVRKLLHRPGRSVVVHAQAAVAAATAIGGMAKGMRGPFNPPPGQSLEDQIVELGLLVNRLREELLTQDQEHRQAVDTLRQQTDGKLQAEQARADAALNLVGEELERLRETTTGGLRVQIDGALGVLVGVIFTTWPENFATRLSWLPFRVVIVVVFLYACLRVLLAWVKHYDARAAAGQLSTGQNWLRQSLKRAAGAS